MEKPTGYASVGMLFAVAKSMALRYGVVNISDIQLDAQSNGIKFILTSGDTVVVPFDASELPFNPGTSGINENNVQDAIYAVNKRSTYKAFPSSWTTDATIADLMADVENDISVKVGDAYLGEVACSDLPFNGNSELVIEVMNDNGINKTLVATLTSGNISPYFWIYTYWNGSGSGWKGFLTPEDVDTSNFLKLNDGTAQNSNNNVEIKMTDALNTQFKLSTSDNYKFLYFNPYNQYNILFLQTGAAHSLRFMLDANGKYAIENFAAGGWKHILLPETDGTIALTRDIAAKVPDAPTTDGTYVLKAVVLNGTPTYQWVLENV